MTRATPLPPDERRRALIDATCTLLLEHGSSVSTRQIAEAAGVAEGTIFRVFASKQELVDASIEHVLCPETVIGRLRHVDASSLDDAVTTIIGLLLDHIGQTRALMHLLDRQRSEDEAPTDKPWRGHHGKGHRGHLHAELVGAIEDALVPHAAAISVTPALAATSLFTLSIGAAFAAPEGSVPEPATVARILLHGIAREDTC